MPDIVLINPRFEVSYRGMDHAHPFRDQWANLPVACLPEPAALTPEGQGHSVTLIDENGEAINFDGDYRGRDWRHLKYRRDTGMLFSSMVKIAQHDHICAMATRMASGRTQVYKSY